MVPETDQKVMHASDEPHGLAQNGPEKTKQLNDELEDSMAAGYVDPTLQIDSAENSRLLRKIHWQ